MSDTVQLIVTLSKGQYEHLKELNCGSIGAKIIFKAVQRGIPLDDVKAEIEQLNPVDYGSMFSYESHNGARDMQGDILNILDNIGKAESEDKG